MDKDVARYISLAPDDAEWARRAVAPYVDMTPEERLEALSALNGWIDAILGGRMPETKDGELPFFMHWRDPSLGRPR
jgi:hypothetical protein